MREIARAFLTSNRPEEVYRVALKRVAPMLGASFGCIFLTDPEDERLLKVAAACNWPQRYASYLGKVRVRAGKGPTGSAVAGNRVVEVFDVFSDPELEEWWEPARELGFSSSISLPLAFRGKPAGALTLYFDGPGSLAETDRSLLRIVADQLAAAAEKAHLIEDLGRANERLRDQNRELELRVREAREARRLKDEILSNVSHELRTPLTAVLGYAQLLREGIPDKLKGEQAAAVERIELAASALLGLIDDLLDLTRLKLGKLTVEPRLADAVEVAREAAESLPPPAGITLRSELPDKPVPIRADLVLVRRLLHNLLSNAFKFAPGGTVTLRVSGPSEKDRTARWEVEDDGIGVSPEHQQAIFDEFRQVDGSPTRKFGGVGLGLALSRAISKTLGGELTVRSEEGKGAVFTFSLPAAEAQ